MGGCVAGKNFFLRIGGGLELNMKISEVYVGTLDPELHQFHRVFLFVLCLLVCLSVILFACLLHKFICVFVVNGRV